MNYTIEYPENKNKLSTSQYHVNFITVYYGEYKANIVTEWVAFPDCSPTMKSAFFRLRDLNDNLIKTNSGNVKVKIKGIEFKNFKESEHNIELQKGDKTENENMIALIIAVMISENYTFNKN